MNPFKEFKKEIPTVEQYMATFKVNHARAADYRRQAASEHHFLNDQYMVSVSGLHSLPGFPLFTHLTIERVDGKAAHSWSDFQAIKNMLVGEENEAVEVYPAESRLVDMANQYHLWVFIDPTYRFPVGWNFRQVRSEVHPE